MSTDQIRKFYVDIGRQVFDKASLLNRLKYSYNDEPLAEKLRSELDKAPSHPANPTESHATLGDGNLRSLLMMVMRNATTDSPWPASNNPPAKYNQLARHDCNLRLPLWQLMRASTAAPIFFPPEVVSLAQGSAQEYEFIFLDGGVTTYNNPDFLAFQMATAAPYQVGWETGADQLLIASVGTGSAPKARYDLNPDDLHLLGNAKNLPGALINTASAGWDMACRVVGDCRYGPVIDRELGDMVVGPGNPANATKLYTYVRFDPDVSQFGIDALGLNDIRAEKAQVMESVQYIPQIQQTGMAYASNCVSLDYLRGFL